MSPVKVLVGGVVAGEVPMAVVQEILLTCSSDSSAITQVLRTSLLLNLWRGDMVPRSARVDVDAVLVHRSPEQTRMQCRRVT